jgi:hypothetical protein
MLAATSELESDEGDQTQTAVEENPGGKTAKPGVQVSEFVEDDNVSVTSDFEEDSPVHFEPSPSPKAHALSSPMPKTQKQHSDDDVDSEWSPTQAATPPKARARSKRAQKQQSPADFEDAEMSPAPSPPPKVKVPVKSRARSKKAVEPPVAVETPPSSPEPSPPPKAKATAKAKSKPKARASKKQHAVSIEMDAAEESPEPSPPPKAKGRGQSKSSQKRSANKSRSKIQSTPLDPIKVPQWSSARKNDSARSNKPPKHIEAHDELEVQSDESGESYDDDNLSLNLGPPQAAERQTPIVLARGRSNRAKRITQLMAVESSVSSQSSFEMALSSRASEKRKASDLTIPFQSDLLHDHTNMLQKRSKVRVDVILFFFLDVVAIGQCAELAHTSLCQTLHPKFRFTMVTLYP